MIHYDLPPVGVDPEALSSILTKLPDVPEAAKIIYASRLYKTALELIESRPDISYQLLISTVETLASAALADFEPTDPEKLKTRESFLRRAHELDIETDKAEILALETCKGNPWSRRKFNKFLQDFASREELSGRDSLFILSEHVSPKPENFGKVIDQIYGTRSGNLHGGAAFPESVGVGTAPSIKWKEFRALELRRKEIPPVTWFERVVSSASRTYVKEKCSVQSAPFVDSY